MNAWNDLRDVKGQLSYVLDIIKISANEMEEFELVEYISLVNKYRQRAEGLESNIKLLEDSGICEIDCVAGKELIFG